MSAFYVKAWDGSCPQPITARLSQKGMTNTIQGLPNPVAEPEAENSCLQATTRSNASKGYDTLTRHLLKS